MTKEEVNNLIKLRREEDELKVVKVLEHGCSVSGGIFQKIGLTGHTIKQALAELSRSRIEQTALRSVICATHFKFAQEGKLYPTKCDRCGQRDSFLHMVACTGVRLPEPSEDPDPTIKFLKEIARKVSETGHARPSPFLEPTGQHLDLDLSEDSDADFDTLEFD